MGTDPERARWRIPSPQLSAFRAGTALGSVLPGRVNRAVAESLGIAAGRAPMWTAMQRRRKLVSAHLRRLYGPSLGRRELQRHVDEVFASYARYWGEMLRLPGLSTEAVKAGMALEGFDQLVTARQAGLGVILALPHLGGWEWAGMYLARTGWPVTVVVEALARRDVFDWFVSFRRALGMEVVAVGPGAGPAAMRALAANRVLCLLCDRVVGGTAGVTVEFFGEATQLPAGPVTLARRSGAPLIPAAVYFGSGADEHLAVLRPVLRIRRSRHLRDDVRLGTQALAVELEGLIRRDPTQWHLMAPNWPSDGA